MRIKIIGATSKWGRKMEKLVSKETTEIYAKMFVENLTGEEVTEVVTEGKQL